ncbi:MAG TPA: cyclic nucleotide-binding domain-containing protein [Beijerinckia sp.]|jgi:CRP-like cAMP-binding protein|nr:cyclic nucleotide-binding domain-containing protein [Beijerinckia sp.]
MGLEEDIRNLAGTPTFAELEPDARRMIAASAETRLLRAGDVLFRRNELSDGGFLVLSGSIAMDVSNHGGVAIRVVGPQTLIGDTALLTRTRRPATAIAREPTKVLHISREVFHRALQKFPVSAEHLRQSLAARLGTLMQELDHARFIRALP